MLTTHCPLLTAHCSMTPAESAVQTQLPHRASRGRRNMRITDPTDTPNSFFAMSRSTSTSRSTSAPTSTSTSISTTPDPANSSEESNNEVAAKSLDFLNSLSVDYLHARNLRGVRAPHSDHKHTTPKQLEFHSQQEQGGLPFFLPSHYNRSCHSPRHSSIVYRVPNHDSPATSLPRLLNHLERHLRRTAPPRNHRSWAIPSPVERTNRNA